ncbi:methyltransferase domain-containing protein [Nocardia sp. NPDC052001]|uniref:class I SAM-dependent methyltransferase n=1 Tax=Nocardia sp. NPDC052001 TaxID=3154853 RepID=UPI003421287C
MNDSATTWGSGDYPLMARYLEPAALAAVEAAGIAPGDRVIDVATGTGNAALAAAARGGAVVGVDFEPALLRVARERGVKAGAEIRWLTGAVEELPVQDDSADVALSVFGVMYAGDHTGAARELARVTAPGGRVALASWVPGSVLPDMGRVLGEFLPPPPAASGPPSAWGDAAGLATILEPHRLRITAVTRGQLTLPFSGVGAGVDFLIRTAGHIVREQDRLTAAGRWEDLRYALRLFIEQRAEHRGDGLALPLDYLLAAAVKE